MRPAPSSFVLTSLSGLLAGALTGCFFEPGKMTGDDGPDRDPDPVEPTGCPAGHAGAECVIALRDEVAGDCDAEKLATLREELDARAGIGPLWFGGRALFRTDGVRGIAGTFNDWSPTAFETAALCNSDLIVGVTQVASGFHTYKLVSNGGATWSMDPANPAFAYDDFEGNADGRNSVLNTPDSGRGHLVELDRACSAALGNCRDVTAYLPPGYHAPAAATTTYPVLFMHDGRNVWDDHDCCFGHTGWEVNVALDTEIAAGRVAPVIIVAADQTTDRNNEYGLSPTRMAAFMEFQVTELQPHALEQVRGNGQLYVAGSSLGGLVSLELALRYPQAYDGAASLSGAFWPNMDTQEALRDHLPIMGKQPLAMYLDHGGNVATNSDGAADSVEIRDLLVDLGWQRADSPSCTPGPNALCYFHEAGATHDELAWRERAWRFLRFLFPR
jgi:predicted alpha/beta superfamily hydrolase